MLNDMPDIPPQIANVAGQAIRRYDDLKLELASIAQAAMLQCAKAKNEEGERAFQRLLGRLAEDRFNLAVVGPFSRGKSSLMNAILGFEGLPTGLLPHTSVITTVTYGPRERVLVRCEGWSLPQEIGLNQLEEYVTERGNPRNQRRVALAEIQLPAEILRHGLHFIDTPGVGSAIVANTETTESFLPEIDAAIFVSSFDSALSESDIEFLRRVRATVGVVFFVLNKLDLVSRPECEEVARFVRQRLDREVGAGCYALFAVSAKRALEARMNGDSPALAECGLAELEAALATFMATDKTRQLMVRVIDRLVRCLQRESLRAGFGLAASRSPEQIAKALEKLDQALAAIKAYRMDLASRLEAAGNDTLRAAEHRIETAFTNVKRRALKKFLPEFLAGEMLSPPAAFEGFTRRMSRFCEEALTRELQLYEAALNEHWTRTGGPLLKQIGELPDELFTNAIDADGSACEGLKPDGQTLGTVAPRLEIGGVPSVNWNPRPPWWLYLRPLGFLSGKMKREFGALVNQLLAQYRSNVEEIIRRTMTEYVDRMNRQTERALDDRAASMRRALVQAGTSTSYETFQQLLGQARKVRARFHDEGRAPTRVTESASGSVDSEVTTPSAPITRVRACPICRRVVEAVFDYLSKLQYELSTEVKAQNDHAETGGFCSAHTWIYSSLTSPVAISRAYPALLDSYAARLRLAACGAASVDRLAREIREACPSWRNCTACIVSYRAADKAVEDLLAALDVGGRVDVPSLCLPHLELALQRTGDLEGSRLLAIGCADALSRVADDMRRHGLKHDAIRRDLMTADERDAPQKGLRKLVGEMRLVLPPNEDRRL